MPGSFTGPVSFYAPGEDAWWDAVDKALRGASRSRLHSRTEDGFDVAPLYARAQSDAVRPAGRASGAWSIVQRIDIADPVVANAQILADLEGGADGLEIVFAGPDGANGVRVPDIGAMRALLKDVQLDLVTVRLDGEGVLPAGLALMIACLEQHKLDPSKVSIHGGFDPFARFATSGSLPVQPDVYFTHLKDMVRNTGSQGGDIRVLSADGRAWHSAGATPAQELAAVLAAGVSHLRLLEETDAPEETWAGAMSFTLCADADQFGTIAKARAFRALWSCVLEGAGLPQSPAYLHMSTSSRMLTRNDPWVNLLRNTVAAFAAGIGGADSVCVVPHTQAVGLPDEFARRLARNTQSILLEESNLAKVIDPSAGSGAIEARTARLCEAAWSGFQEIEAAGGLLRALETGLVQDKISAAKAERAARVATRKHPITGVSEFPDLGEVGVQVMPDAPAVAPEPGSGMPRHILDALPGPGNGDWFAGLCKAVLEGHSPAGAASVMEAAASARPIGKLETQRVSEPFERLREAAACHSRDNGVPARVFLASLGSLAAFTARATWASNAFAAGGIKAVGPAVYSTVDELVAAYEKSGAAIACLVSSDDVYETHGEEAARRLRDAGAGHVYLAGRPGARQDAYEHAGVGTFLYAGCDLLALLEKAHELLGIASSDPLSGEDRT